MSDIHEVHEVRTYTLQATVRPAEQERSMNKGFAIVLMYTLMDLQDEVISGSNADSF